MSGDNPKLILDGRKTQTRRIIRLQSQAIVGDVLGQPQWYLDGDPERIIRCPYGVAGDRLWVRETWRPTPYRAKTKGKNAVIQLRSDNVEFEVTTPGIIKCDEMHKWRPSIFMPRKLSRITLEITKVRVERLQDISEEDAKAEGINGVYPSGSDELTYINGPGGYRWLWDSLHGKGAWQLNPWVWVIEFCSKRVTDCA